MEEVEPKLARWTSSAAGPVHNYGGGLDLAARIYPISWHRLQLVKRYSYVIIT